MMIVRRTPTRRSLLEENRHLRMTNAELSDAIDKLLEQTEKDTRLALIGDRMARQLKRSTSPRTQSIVAEWGDARGS